MATLMLLRQSGAMAWNPTNSHPPYLCTGCLGCQVPCEFDTDVPAWLAGERERIWAAGGAPPQVVEVAERVAAGEPADPGAGHHADLDGPRFSGEGIVYWPGCALVGGQPDAVRRNRELLEDVLGEPVRLPPQTAPACCGDPLAAAGDRSRSMAHRASMMDALRGASRVVTSCACCMDSLPTGAEHLVSLLGFTWPVTGEREPVAFHDPCRLARPTDQGGAPRALLAAATGAPVVEFVDRGSETACCGAGDSYGLFFPQEGRLTAGHRLRDPAVARVKTVVTTCSRCTAQLAAVAPEGLAVVDLGAFLHGTRRDD